MDLNRIKKKILIHCMIKKININVNMEISSRIPDLSPNKEYHLFVCYERNSLRTVEEIVQNLEKEGVVCCYSERDFAAGTSITYSIYNAIEKSMNMLIVLSEELENSPYCLDEIDKAFNLRVQGQYNLIPIRIEPCFIPVCLQHLVYIDVEESIDEAHTKIIDAMVKKDQQNALKEDSNGKNIKFGLKANKPNCLSLTRYRLTITERELSKLWKQQFQVSAEILQEIEDTVNGSYFIRLHHVIDHQYLLMTFVYLYFLILIFIIFSTLVLMLEREKTDELTSAEMYLAVGLPTWLISYAASIMILIMCHGHTLVLFKLKWKLWTLLCGSLWKISRQYNQQTGVIFFLEHDVSKETKHIQFYVMHINFKPCKLYFERQLAKENKEYLKSKLKEDESHEEYTSRMFDSYLARSCGHLTDISLQSRRHKMTNGAKCVCLLVDDWLKDLSKDS